MPCNRRPELATNAASSYNSGRRMNIDAIPIGKSPPDDLNVIIEVPLGGEPIKYEIDKSLGARCSSTASLYTPMRYPGKLRLHPAYAVRRRRPARRAGDEFAARWCRAAVVRCRAARRAVHGGTMGGQDEKILAVPVHKLTAMYDNVHDIADVQPIQVERVKHFFTHYKDLEPGKWAKISHVGGLGRSQAGHPRNRSSAPKTKTWSARADENDAMWCFPPRGH